MNIVSYGGGTNSSAISYQGTMTMEELLCGDPVERVEHEMGGMA